MSDKLHPNNPLDAENSDHIIQDSVPQFPEKSGYDLSTDVYPEGGLRAWLVVAGAACTLFATLGNTNTFGVFFIHYQTHQLSDKSPDTIAWIGSVQATLFFASGVVGGPLFDRFGAWVRTFQP